MADLFQPKNAEELVQRFLRDVRLAALAENITEPPTQVGTDTWLIANGIAGMCLLGFGNIAIAEEATNVLTATGDDLDDLREGYGIPEVAPTAASGKIKVSVLGSTTITNGLRFVYPNGVIGQVVGTFVNPTDGDEIDVAATVTGAKGNLKAGQKVRFVTPPINVVTEATVSQAFPLLGGTDEEDDERKRARILNVLRNKPAGGNWGQIRQIALDAVGSVVDCYVFPALGGPASVKAVPVKDFDVDENDYSRAMSAVALNAVRNAIQSTLSAGIECVVQAATDQPVDVGIKVTIPDSVQSGGNGDGWTDIEPWPTLESGDAGRVTVTASPSDPSIIEVSAQTPTSPITGQTHIAWWSSVDRRFRTALVVNVSGSSGAWTLELDKPLVDSTGAWPAIGDYICPAAQNLEAYGSTWINIFRTFGTGENTASTQRLPRARRHPFVASEDPAALTNSVLAYLVGSHPEITDYEYSYRSSSTPTVPGSTASSPNILTPRRFGVYPQ